MALDSKVQEWGWLAQVWEQKALGSVCPVRACLVQESA